MGIKHFLSRLRENETVIFVFNVFITMVGLLRIKQKILQALRSETTMFLVTFGALFLYVYLIFVIVVG